MSGLDTWRRVAFGLGSNLGNRLEHLQSAVNHILDRPTVAPFKVSKVYETDPVGGPEQPDYLNAVLVVDTTITVAGLLSLAHDCETAPDAFAATDGDHEPSMSTSWRWLAY